MTPDPAEIAAIRRRHEEDEASGWVGGSPYRAHNCHQDRATLLAALAREQADNERMYDLLGEPCERCASLRLELQASESNRVKENEYLIQERDTLRAQLEGARARLSEDGEEIERMHALIGPRVDAYHASDGTSVGIEARVHLLAEAHDYHRDKQWTAEAHLAQAQSQAELDHATIIEQRKYLAQARAALKGLREWGEPELDDARLSWISVQIERADIERADEALAALPQPPPPGAGETP